MFTAVQCGPRTPTLSPCPAPALVLILVSFSVGSRSRGERGLCLGALRTLAVALGVKGKGAQNGIRMAGLPCPG